MPLPATSTRRLALLLAGLAIFPAVFALGFNPAGGPALLFQTIPAVFATLGNVTGDMAASNVVATGEPDDPPDLD